WRDAKQEAQDFYDNLAKNIQAAADAYDEARFSLEKWTASVMAGDERLAEESGVPTAIQHYAELKDRIDSAVKAYDAMQDPIDEANRKTQAFNDSLQVIAVQAQLLGTRFDGVGATISAMEQRLAALAELSNGQVTPAMQDLAAQLEQFYQFRDLR